MFAGGFEAGITHEALFDQLQQAADRLGERAVVIVEGVNEGRGVNGGRQSVPYVA